MALSASNAGSKYAMTPNNKKNTSDIQAPAGPTRFATSDLAPVKDHPGSSLE